MIDCTKPPDNGRPMRAVLPDDPEPVVELCWELRKLQTAIEKQARRRARILASVAEVQEVRRALRERQEAGDEAAKVERHRLYDTIGGKLRQIKQIAATLRKMQAALLRLSREREAERTGVVPVPPVLPLQRPPPPEPVVVIRRRR